jgi:hypothetical protein
MNSIRDKLSKIKRDCKKECDCLNTSPCHDTLKLKIQIERKYRTTAIAELKRKSEKHEDVVDHLQLEIKSLQEKVRNGGQKNPNFNPNTLTSIPMISPFIQTDQIDQPQLQKSEMSKVTTH